MCVLFSWIVRRVVFFCIFRGSFLLKELGDYLEFFGGFMCGFFFFLIKVNNL